MMVDVQAMKTNYSKEDFVWILGNLFLATGWLRIGIHYLHSALIAAPLTLLRSIFQFNRIQLSLLISVTLQKVDDIGISLYLLTPSLSWTVVVSVNSVKSVLSLLCRLSTRRYAHLLLSADACSALQLSIDISCLQQQTRRPPLLLPIDGRNVTQTLLRMVSGQRQ